MRFLCLPVILLLACTADARPSVTVILSDDMRADDVQHMPKTLSLMGDAVVFEAAFSPLPMCVPSRAALLSGRLPSRTGVRSNKDTHLFDPSDTIATRLHEAGYRTGILGKYLNQPEEARAPLGWDAAVIFEGQHDYGREQGRELARRAKAFRRGGNPFFLLVSTTFPHSPLRGPEKCERDFPPAPHPELEDLWQRRLSALCGLDDLVASLVRSRRRNEYVVFTSDNGWILEPGKRKAELNLDAAMIPLVVWGPDVQPARLREIVSLVDLSRTVLDLSGVSGHGMDGQSFAVLMRGERPTWTGTLVLEGTTWGR